jgi:transcriptional regulator with XRE-family HTH domain
MHATVTAPAAITQTRWLAVVARARALGWSQNELARRLRTNQGHLSRVVRGDRDSAKLLARAERLVARSEGRKSA